VESVVAAHERDGAKRQRQIERPTNLHAKEAGGRNADDVELALRQGELASDDIRIPAVFALPEGVADDQPRRAAASLIIRSCKEVPQRRLTPQLIKKIPPHEKHPCRPPLPAWREVDAVCTPDRDAGKGLLLSPAPLPNPIGNRRCAPG